MIVSDAIMKMIVSDAIMKINYHCSVHHHHNYYYYYYSFLVWLDVFWDRRYVWEWYVWDYFIIWVFNFTLILDIAIRAITSCSITLIVII